MPYRGYEYKQQCCVPKGVQTTPVFRQCQCHQCHHHHHHHHPPSLVKHISCTPCAPGGAKIYTVRKTMQSSPKCSAPCSSGCVETHIVRGHSSSCSPRCPHPCTVVLPQPPVQGRGHLCVPHCGQQGVSRCPQVSAPAPTYHPSSYPYSYQWFNSYHYNCGQE